MARAAFKEVAADLVDKTKTAPIITEETAEYLPKEVAEDVSKDASKTIGLEANKVHTMKMCEQPTKGNNGP